MKIAFLNIYNGLIERGSEVFVHELATELSEKAQVAVFQVGQAEREKYRVEKINWIPQTSHFYHLWVAFFTIFCLPRLWIGKYDWLIPVNGRIQSIIIRFFRFFRGGKILMSGHAGVGFDDRFNIVLGKPDVFVALTPLAYKWAFNLQKGVKIIYIPNGVDTIRFHPRIKPVNLPLPKPIVLCVSALLPYKQINLLIQAVSQLKDVNLLVIGDGPLKKGLTDFGENLLGKRFQLIKNVSHQEIGSYYKAVQVFSLPSKSTEAFGLVYLEAMACNIPVVVPSDENRKEIVGEGGLFTNPENVNEYANTLEKALRMNFGNKPRFQAEKFSWEKISLQYLRVFRNIP